MIQILECKCYSGQTTQDDDQPKKFMARVVVAGTGMDHEEAARLIKVLPDFFYALEAIENLTRGTPSTHVHKVAVDALNKAGWRQS